MQRFAFPAVRYTAALFVLLGVLSPFKAIAQSSGAASRITEYSLIPDARPFGITTGPDGALWFTQGTPSAIGRITTSGAISSFGGLLYVPLAITSGPDGALWFTETDSISGSNAIGKITVSGTVTEFPLATYYPGPSSIVTGPDSALWFTEPGLNSIGRITTDGVVTSYPVGGPINAGAQEITVGPDGALWFTTGTNFTNQSEIGRITTNGAVTLFPLSSNVYPYGITTGSDGALWFTEYYGNKIGRITTAGLISEYPVPTPNAKLQEITAGGDGALWFVETGGNQIGRITTRAVITELPSPITKSSPFGITAGPDGALWLTEQRGYIGRAPACGLGLRLNFSPGVLNLSFDLGNDVASTFTAVLITATGKQPLFARSLPAVVPSRVLNFPVASGIPSSGTVEVKATLSDTPGQYTCQEYKSITVGNGTVP